jgi:hypothetical protein
MLIIITEIRVQVPIVEAEVVEIIHQHIKKQNLGFQGKKEPKMPLVGLKEKNLIRVRTGINLQKGSWTRNMEKEIIQKNHRRNMIK